MASGHGMQAPRAVMQQTTAQRDLSVILAKLQQHQRQSPVSTSTSSLSNPASPPDEARTARHSPAFTVGGAASSIDNSSRGNKSSKQAISSKSVATKVRAGVVVPAVSQGSSRALTGVHRLCVPHYAHATIALYLLG